MWRAHRTDALLAATLVAAGATAYVGIWQVDWKSKPDVKVALVVARDRAMLTLGQRF
jgi:hypothetical protein